MNDAEKIGYIAASILTVVTAWASYDSLHTASYILYNDHFLIPIATTITIALLSFGGMFAYPHLRKPAERLIDRIRNDFESEDDLEIESWRRD